MAERFTQLFHATDSLYGVGSPILIVAGVLLYDEGTGSVVAQLKFQNITEKPIKAVKIKLGLLDSGSRKLGEPLEYQYCLDLYAERDDEFGQKTAIILSDRTARSFSVSVIEVIFSDDSIWTGNEEPWNYTLKKSRLEELGDPELAVQYCIETTGYSECVPCVYKEYDLWRCACGVINHTDEKVCHSCGQELDFLLSFLDVGKLKAARDKRLQKEHEEEEALRIQRAKEAEEEKKRKEAEEERIATEKAAKAAVKQQVAQERMQAIQNGWKKIKKVLPIAVVLIGLVVAIAYFLSLHNDNSDYLYQATLDSYPGIVVSADDKEVLDEFIDAMVQTDIDSGMDKIMGDSNSSYNTPDINIQVEEVWFEYDSDLDMSDMHVKGRNASGQQLSVVTFNVDYLDKKGDIIGSCEAQYNGLVDDGQACTATEYMLDVIPDGVRIASGWVSDPQNNTTDFYMETPFVMDVDE